MNTPKPTYLKDYKKSQYLIDHVNLIFELDPVATIVRAEVAFYQDQDLIGNSVDLFLDGNRLDMLEINSDEIGCEYEITDRGLLLKSPPKKFTLRTTVKINPKENTALKGLYMSNGIFCTQCESEFFRSITYFLDRPDVLTLFTVKIIADKKTYPVLLSNGNLIEQGDLDGGKHFALWQDPFKKPCYLFALVAGDLQFIEDEFMTMSDRKVCLRIYSEPQNINKCQHAMTSLIKSMRWDEVNYGREYDLDIFNIVAVNDFVFGAMENKSLNIFNAKYILARPETATDYDYAGIDTVVAHEYFHNWSGNRVTCRDWFQLSLKEGLTVFREQSFDEDNISPVVHRIRKVQDLRNSQYQEDAGPMAHPVRPESYMTIDNFYTRTVYNKGSELIRMQKTLLGDVAYRKAIEEYFSRFDGMAVTTDDFISVMQESSGVDLSQFKLWYSQAGTPSLTMSSRHDQAAKKYYLHVQQTVPDTPGQVNKKPMLIPLSIALLSDQGSEVLNEVLSITKAEQEFVFDGIDSPVVPSLLRFFSAPVKLYYPYSEDELAFLMAYDQDGFNRWEAAQRFASKLILTDNVTLESKEKFCQAYEQLLISSFEDRLLQAELLTLPSEQSLAEMMDIIDVDIICQRRDELACLLVARFESDYLHLYENLQTDEAYQYNREQMGKRALKNLCLRFLVLTGKQIYINLAFNQFKKALGSNMTDCLAALTPLSHLDALERVEALSLFEERWIDEPLVMGKWFSVQALSHAPNVLKNIQQIMRQPFFNIKNPNDVYALLLSFTRNIRRFHAADGSGYRFVAEQVLQMDKLNPMVAATLVEPLISWRRYDLVRQKLMRQQLEIIFSVESLSVNVYECVSKSL